MDIETLMAEANSEPVREQPHRNDKYKPVIHTLAADKNMTTQQIYEWFKAKNITVGTGYIARVRRLHLKSIGEDEESESEQESSSEASSGASPTGSSSGEGLQPVARTRSTTPHEAGHPN